MRRLNYKNLVETILIVQNFKLFSSDPKDDEGITTLGQNNFKSFTIEFNEPIAYKRKVNCIKLIKQAKQNSFKIYRAIDSNTNDICLVYEWTICLEKNKIFENKKLETCISEFKKIEEELRKLMKLSNNNLLNRYLAYKAYKQTDKPFFIIQVRFFLSICICIFLLTFSPPLI